MSSEDRGLESVVSSFHNSMDWVRLEEVVQSDAHWLKSVDDVVDDSVSNLFLDGSSEELGGQLVYDVMLSVSNGDGESIDIALDVEESNEEGLVRRRLQLPNDSKRDSCSLREIDISDSVVFDSGHSLSSVEESDILEESSNSIDFHNDSDGSLLGRESLNGHLRIGLGVEVDELGKQVSNVEQESFDAKVVLRIGSLDLRNREVRELLREDRDDDLSHL